MEPRPPGDPVHINDLVVEDGVAWLATARSLFAVDVIDAAEPRVLSEDGAGLYRVDVSGGAAVVSGRWAGLRRVQLAGEQLEAEATYNSPDFVPGGVALLNDYVLVGTTGDGLEVRRRADFELVTSLTELSNVVDVAVEGDIAVAIDRDLGLVVIDITEPTAPVVRGSLQMPGAPQGVALRHTQAYVAASASLVIVDVSDADTPITLSDVATDGVATRVAVDGDLVAVANWFDTRVYDVTDGTAPVLVGVEKADQSSMSVALDDGVLYVGDWDWMRTYSVDPSVGGPDVSAPPLVSLYGGVGQLRTTFRLENVGDRPLDATLECDDSRLSVTPSATIEAGDRALIEVSTTTVDANTWTVFCDIVSNDPDEPYRGFAVEVNPAGLQVGDPAPDWTLPDLNGEIHTLSDHQGEVVFLTLWAGL